MRDGYPRRMAEARLVVTALAMMLAMFLAGIYGLRHRVGILILALLSLTWFTVDKLFEGGVLLHVSKTNGITVSDLIGILGVLISGLVWWYSARNRHVASQAAHEDGPARGPLGRTGAVRRR